MRRTTPTGLTRFRPPRRLVPTRAGIFVLVSPIVMGAIAINAGNNLLFFVLGASLGLIVLSGVVSERIVRGIQVEVSRLEDAYAGERTRLLLSIKRGDDNRRRGPIFATSVWLRSAGFLPTRPKSGLCADFAMTDESAPSVIVEHVFRHRGLERDLPLELATRAPFGLFTKARDLTVDVAFVVRPKRVSVPEILLRPPAVASDRARSPKRGIGVEVAGLRERDERDTLRRIHALRTLRLGYEVVVETEQAMRPTAILGILNRRGANPEAFERALEIAAATFVKWDEEGFDVGLITLDDPSEPAALPLDDVLDRIATLVLVEADVPLLPDATWLIPRGASFLGADDAQGASRIHVDADGSVRVATGADIREAS